MVLILVVLIWYGAGAGGVDMVRWQGHYPHQEDARAGAVGHHCFLHLRLHCITIIPLASISRFLMLSKCLE